METKQRDRAFDNKFEKKTTKIPRPKRKRARVAERETIWLAAHLTRKSVAFGSHPLYHPNKKKCKSNANFNVIFFYFIAIFIYFSFCFSLPLCAFSFVFFCSLHFPPFGHAHRHAPSWLAAATTPTASSWILGHRSRHADAGPLLGQMTRQRKKKYFKKMNGLMNLSIPKPNWKWIETKSNESFVKTKQKNMLKKQQQHRRQQLETNFNRRIFLRNYQENYLKRKKNHKKSWSQNVNEFRFKKKKFIR